MAELLGPVQPIATDDLSHPPEVGVALCLSGGGYRAMLFHLGVLWRLNQLGYLPKLKRISSVSGGSITAAVLGLAWSNLAFDEHGVGQGFIEHVAAPIHRLANVRIDLEALLRGIFGPGSVHDAIAAAYRKHLFQTHTLQDLPSVDEGPRFVINAANLQSGALWRFSKPYSWDWRVGQILNPTTELAVAVAASSAAPPLLSPAVLKFKSSDYTPGTGHDLQKPAYMTRAVLTDGGVYDNLGLETAWKRYQTILVSNGGAKIGAQERPDRDVLRHAMRVISVIDNQVRSLRQRQVIASYKLPAGHPLHRDGAYWGIRSDIAKYSAAGTLPCPHDKTLALAGVSTRLSLLSQERQQQLVNWGYAICDAGMRAHVDAALPPPDGFPYPSSGVG